MAKLNWSNVKKQSRIIRYGAEDISGSRILDEFLKSELHSNQNSGTLKSSKDQESSLPSGMAECQYCKKGVKRTKLLNHIENKCPAYRLQQNEASPLKSTSKASSKPKQAPIKTNNTSSTKTSSTKTTTPNPTGEIMDLRLTVNAAGQIKINHLDPGRVVYVNIQYESRET